MTPFVREVLAKQPGVDLRSFALRSNSDVLHLAAIAGGVGIGVAQVSLASRDPSLVRMLLDAFSHDLPLWIAMHEDPRTSPRCRAVFDTMVRGLSPIAT